MGGNCDRLCVDLLPTYIFSVILKVGMPKAVSSHPKHRPTMLFSALKSRLSVAAKASASSNESLPPLRIQTPTKLTRLCGHVYLP